LFQKLAFGTIECFWTTQMHLLQLSSILMD
jgi:hypothetical protein